MRILVAGMGAIGSLLASYLSRNNELSCLGREWHINKIKERGYLRLKVLFKSIEMKVILDNIYTSVKDIENHYFDCVFVCVKAYDLEKLLKELIQHSIRSDCYVFFQNGLGIEEIAMNLLRNTNILRAITNNGANIPEPGVVIHAGLGLTYISGIHGDKANYYAETLVHEFNSVNLPAKYVKDIQTILYTKLAVNSVINPLTALLEIRNGELIKNKWLKPIIKSLCDEVTEIARKVNVNVGDLEKTVLDVAEKTSQNVSSMLQDVKRGKRTEIDYINGAIVKLSKKLGVEAKANELIYYLIKAKEERLIH